MSKLSIRNLSPRNWIIVVASFIALVCYFLPWYAFVFSKSIVYDSGSGLTFAVAEMTSSGIRGAPLFATPIAAAISLVLCYAYLRQDRSKKIIPIIQFFLGIVGLVPFVPFYFMMGGASNAEVYISYFFLINVLAMIGIPIGALVSYIEIHRQ